ncbi:MAG: DUF2807 domain-containing protein [Bacteroidales bacterium]|nr:DUF2807 domain-containing protein [Bacteroidales bacterium]MBN2818020.1 DUF2807 domain-containing protein [Bacteroidales bacterium]
MKKKVSLGIFIAPFLILLFVTTSKLYAFEEQRDVKDFNEISFSIAGNLILDQGNEFKFTISGNKSDVEEIITKVENGRLIVKTKSHVHNLSDIVVRITLPELRSLDLAGSGDVVAKESFKSDNLNISIAGSGDVVFDNLTAEEVELSIAGSGDMIIKGKTKELEISITGSGDINTVEFTASDVEVNITGSGDAKVYATDKLETNIVGSGSVYYKGKPLIDASSVGSGSTKSL